MNTSHEGVELELETSLPNLTDVSFLELQALVKQAKGTVLGETVKQLVEEDGEASVLAGFQNYV